MEQNLSRIMLWFLSKTLCTKAQAAQLCHINTTVKNSWNKSMTNTYGDKINTEDLRPGSSTAEPDTLGKSKFGNMSKEQKEGSILKKTDATNTSEEGSGTTQPLKHFLPSCFMFVQLPLSFPLLFATSLPSLPILVFPPSLFFFIHLSCSSWQPLDLYKFEGRRRDMGVEVTMACASCLICLDHVYGAYLDNNAACQHLHHTHSHTHTHAALYLRVSNSVKQSICYNYPL